FNKGYSKNFIQPFAFHVEFDVEQLKNSIGYLILDKRYFGNHQFQLVVITIQILTLQQAIYKGIILLLLTA
ncbi:MAG: hypothetical protein PHE56_16220, partial [Bacteroidales bacterium]|nr:hypothetical protein [Bacteroidales bacterium]